MGFELRLRREIILFGTFWVGDAATLTPAASACVRKSGSGMAWGSLHAHHVMRMATDGIVVVPRMV